jgi:hypothetical protein
MRFGYWLLALQVAIAAPWLTWDFGRHQMSTTRYAVGLEVLALLVVAFVAWFARTRRRPLKKIIQIEEFRSSLYNENSPDYGDSGPNGA